MKMKLILSLTAALAVLASCGNVFTPGTPGAGQIKDASTDGDLVGTFHSGAQYQAGIWVDGNGCEHWIIDDGIEGYMTTRYVNGKPVCSANNIPYSTRNFNRSVMGQNNVFNY